MSKGLTRNKGGTDLGPVHPIPDEDAREAALVMAGIAYGKRRRLGGKAKTIEAAGDVVEALLGVDYKEQRYLSKKEEEAQT